jgi:hypothetical protein
MTDIGVAYNPPKGDGDVDFNTTDYKISNEGFLTLYEGNSKYTGHVREPILPEDPVIIGTGTGVNATTSLGSVLIGLNNGDSADPHTISIGQRLGSSVGVDSTDACLIGYNLTAPIGAGNDNNTTNSVLVGVGGKPQRDSVVIGKNAAQQNSTDNTIAVGTNACNDNSTASGIDTISVGGNAAQVGAIDYGISVGFSSSQSRIGTNNFTNVAMTAGDPNIFLGFRTGSVADASAGGIAVGREARAGDRSVCIGFASGYSTAASNNQTTKATAIGLFSLRNYGASSEYAVGLGGSNTGTTNGDSVSIGREAGGTTSKTIYRSSWVAIGYRAGPSTDGVAYRSVTIGARTNNTYLINNTDKHDCLIINATDSIKDAQNDRSSIEPMREVAIGDVRNPSTNQPIGDWRRLYYNDTTKEYFWYDQ